MPKKSLLDTFNIHNSVSSTDLIEAQVKIPELKTNFVFRAYGLDLGKGTFSYSNSSNTRSTIILYLYRVSVYHNYSISVDKHTDL